MKRLLEVTAGMVSGQECNPEPWINPCRWDHPSSLPLLQILPEIHVQDRAVPETSPQEACGGHLPRGVGARDGKGEVGNLGGFRRAPPGGVARGGGAERGMPRGSRRPGLSGVGRRLWRRQRGFGGASGTTWVTAEEQGRSAEIGGWRQEAEGRGLRTGQRRRNRALRMGVCA